MEATLHIIQIFDFPLCQLLVHCVTGPISRKSHRIKVQSFFDMSGMPLYTRKKDLDQIPHPDPGS